MSNPRVALGADPLGGELKDAIKSHLIENHPELQIDDAGTGDKYYEVATNVAAQVQGGRVSKAILVCGTGQGMAIVANKYPAVYASLVDCPEEAANARGINNANVLTMGANRTKPEQAVEIVDKWLATGFKEGWPDFADFLDQSMIDIPQVTAKISAAGAAAATPTNGSVGACGDVPFPTAALFVDGTDEAQWQPIPLMGGGDKCMWCKLREDAAAAAGGGSATRLRALVRFPKGAIEPPHRHTHGHDQLVLEGRMTVSNLTTAQNHELKRAGYLYTPVGQIHSVSYHEDTMFYLSFEGPMDLIWTTDVQGVQWQKDEGK